jgi:hypothetical protein
MWLFIEPLAMLKRMWPAARPALLGGDERQVDRVGDEVGVQQQPFCSPLLAK